MFFSSCTCFLMKIKMNNKVRLKVRWIVLCIFYTKKLLYRAKSFWIMVQPITRDPELKNPRTNSRQVSWLTDQHVKIVFPVSQWLRIHAWLHIPWLQWRDRTGLTPVSLLTYGLIKHHLHLLFIIQFLTEYHYFFNFTIVPVIFWSIRPTEVAGIKTKQRK